MGKTRNSGLAHGTLGSPQTSLTQENATNKAKFLNENSKNIAQKIDLKITPIDTSKIRYSENKNKIINYLLNISHSKGGSKAYFFIKVFGYNIKNPKAFYYNVINSIKDKLPYEVEKTEFGIIYRFNTKLRNNRKGINANIIVIMQKDNNKSTFRIISIYPNKKEK